MTSFATFFLLLTLLTQGWAFTCQEDGFFPDPTNCAKFYRCVTGTKYSFDCGPGTHFNPNCDCCDWPYNVNCKASEGGADEYQPSRYQSQSGQYGQQSGQNGQQQQIGGQSGSAQSGQTQWTSGYGQSASGQVGYGQSSYGQQPSQILGPYDQQPGQYGQQPSSQSGQDFSQTYWQPSGQSGSVQPSYGQQSSDNQYPSGQIYVQYPAQSVSGQSGQTYDNYGQQPTARPYSEYGQRQHIPQTVNRQPQESQQIDSRQQPITEEKTQPRKPVRKQYPKTDRRGEQPLEESFVVYEEPEEKKVRPKPRPKPQPKLVHKQDNDLTEEDDQFDHKFDERVEERRPTPRPRPRPQGRRVPPTEEPEEVDEELEPMTTRPKVPKRKYRVRVPTTTTEAPEEDSQFSQFDNELKEDIDDEDTNKWLQREDFETTTTTTTTTEDPFVSMLKERVPPQPRNRSRADRNREYGRRLGTTPTPDRSEESTTTVDPFDKDWVDYIAGKDEEEKPEDRKQSKGDRRGKKKKTKPKDPNLMSDLISYYNCTEAAKDCDVCEELNWIKYSGTGLRSTPFRSYKFLPKIVTKQCYKACSESQQCVAFSYSLTSGMCHIYDQLTTDDIEAKEEFNTVVKNPKNSVMNEEWLHTKNGLISGSELYSLKTDSLMDCLQECVNDMENCLAVNFDSVETNCRLYDAYEGYGVNTVKANSISLQNLGMFEDNNQWRFEEVGHKTLTNGRLIETKPVNEVDECFYECVEGVGSNCSFVTIQEGKGSNTEDEEQDSDNKLCHLFAFNSSPKWIRSKDKSNTSYVMMVSKNHSRIQEYPGYSFVGNPIEIKEGMTEEECRKYAEQECRFCRKYTAVIETQECALFSDSALLSPALSDTNYTERSALLSMPKDSEYMAFKRIPWKMFTTDISPYELKGEINGQKCLGFCLKQKLCVATALVYDTAESSMFCYFFKESDLKNASITEYENVDLFIKTLNESEIPGHVSNTTTDDCSDGESLDSAVKNVNDLYGTGDTSSSKKSSADSDRYKSNSYPLSPHGYDYNSGPNDDQSEQRDDRRTWKNSRVVRSAERKRGQELTDNEAEVDERPKRLVKGEDQGESALVFIERVKQNAQKKNIVDRIPTVSSELRRKVKQIRIESKKSSVGEEREERQPKTRTKQRDGRVDRLSQDCNEENQFVDKSRCKEGLEAEDKSKTCTQMPRITYSDHKSMKTCNETVEGEECQVICRPGYEPTIQNIKCQKSGSNRLHWKGIKQVKCKPIESECESIGNKSQATNVRIRAITRYPEERLHFITRYDTNKQLPQFSAYVHTKQNNENKTYESSDDSTEYSDNTCDELEDKQWSLSDYKQGNYTPKPLLPTTAFHYSKAAESLVKTMSNIAPQDPFTSRGPWLILENRTLEMLKERPGIVITGVCPKSIEPQTKSRYRKKSIEVPQCFWSIACVPFGEGVTTAAFYAENTHPISQLEKQTRVEQVKTIRDQNFVSGLLGNDLYRNVWIETYNGFKDMNKGIKQFIYRCADTATNDQNGLDFWDKVINSQEDNVMKWPTKFQYGLETNDMKKNDQVNRNPKRRVRDHQTEDRQQINSIDNTFPDQQKMKRRCKQKIIGYMTPFGDKSFTETEGRQLTHSILAHIDLSPDGSLGPFEAPTHENTLKLTKLYEQLSVKTQLLNSGHPLKTMVSIGGWNDSQYLSSIVESVEKRNTFIAYLSSMIEYWNLDGIEIDWKYPVKGGVKPGSAEDRDNFVLLLSEIRQTLDLFAKRRGRTEKLLLSITGASGVWMIDDSYDLARIEPLVDWISVQTFDYFGPFRSRWGANTGPNAALYPSAPITSLSKLNIHSTIEKYFCSLNSTSKLVINIPFYGHYWNNVGDPIDTKDPLFRDAHPVGGFVTYRNIKEKWLLNKEFDHFWHNKSLTPYLWSESQRVFLSYDNKSSVEEKVRYAIGHRLGGVSIWALDFDDNGNELLNAIVDTYSKCQITDRDNYIDFDCVVPSVVGLQEQMQRKWWSAAEDGKNEGLCGRSAPLINGFYPICDPKSESMHCCSSWGRCGSGTEFCDCKGCVDYKRNPERANEEPVRPDPLKPILWLTSDQMPNGEESEGIPVCGYKSSVEVNGTHPTCNGDDPNAHCCSADGQCGSGPDYCQCEHCVDFKLNPDYIYPKKIWWDEKDGPQRSGRCGRMAPKIDNEYPICNPNSMSAHCCGKWGLCGSGPLNCKCMSCVDFKKKPNFRWK